MATIAIGDVHGNLRALSDLFDQLRPEVVSGDTVVMLGDYIDRGPDSKGTFPKRTPARRRSSADTTTTPISTPTLRTEAEGSGRD